MPAISSAMQGSIDKYLMSTGHQGSGFHATLNKKRIRLRDDRIFYTKRLELHHGKRLTLFRPTLTGTLPATVLRTTWTTAPGRLHGSRQLSLRLQILIMVSGDHRRSCIQGRRSRGRLLAVMNGCSYQDGLFSRDVFRELDIRYCLLWMPSVGPPPYCVELTMEPPSLICLSV